MNDTQRQAYLHAMGIQQYFPRAVIPGAKPSRVYELPSPAPAPTPATPVQPGPKNTNTARIGRPDLGAKPTTRPARSSTPVAAVSATHTPQSVDNATSTELTPRRFRVNYYRISDTLAVIDEIPYQQATRDATASITLLRAILAAIGVQTDGLQLQAESFDWPHETGMPMTLDPTQDARLALQGYIRKRQETDEFRHLLIFAAQIADILLPDGAQKECDVPVANSNYNRTITHSLQALLAHPILKREVWAQLQPLRRRLVSSTR